MNPSNYEYHQDTEESFRRNKPEFYQYRHQCISSVYLDPYQGERDTPPPYRNYGRNVKRSRSRSRSRCHDPYRGDERDLSPRGCYDRNVERSRSRTRYRSRSYERPYSYERRKTKHSRYRRRSREGSETSRRSKHYKRRHRRSRRPDKRTESRSRSPSSHDVKVTSNTPTIDECAFNTLKEKIRLAVSSTSTKGETSTAVNPSRVPIEWQDTWDIDVGSSSSDQIIEIFSSDESIENHERKDEFEASNYRKNQSTAAYHSIDNEIIQKIIKKRDRETTADQLASTIQFDFDLIRQAVTTGKMLEYKDLSAKNTATHITIDNNTQFESSNSSRLQKVQHFGQKDIVHSEPRVVSNVPLRFTSSSSSSSKSRNLPSPVKLSIPSTKFLPKFPFLPSTSSTPHQHHENFKSTAIQHQEPTTYGDYKRLKESVPSLGMNYKIPKKWNSNATPERIDLTETTNDHFDAANQSPEGMSRNIGQSSTSARSCESAEIVNLDNSSDENENVMDRVENPSAEQKAIATLKKFICTEQFATLVNLIDKMTKHDTPTNLNSALNNSPDDGLVEDECDQDLSTSDGSSSKENNVATTSTSKHPTEKDITSTTTISKRTSNPKNINPEWHSLTKLVSCQICRKPSGVSLVSHYVNEHPDREVFVSRLAPVAADLLRSDQGINKCKVTKKAGSSNYEYNQFCYFCNVHRCINRSAWIVHLSRHTGYYRFKCNHCSRQFASKPLIGKCHDINDYADVLPLHFKKREIMAFVCDICNYVRFHKHEIERHLREEHNVGDLKAFKKINFLSFPCRKGKNKTYTPHTDTESDGSSNMDMEKSDSSTDMESDSNTDVEIDSNTDMESDSSTDMESDSNTDIESDANMENESVTNIESGRNDGISYKPPADHQGDNNENNELLLELTNDEDEDWECIDDVTSDPDYVP